MNHRTGHAMGDVAQQIGHFAWPISMTILFGMSFRWMGWMGPGFCLHAPAWG